MNIHEAKWHLDLCDRSELRDHAFGDREIAWEFMGKEVAGGYFGSQGQDIWINFYDENGKEIAVQSFSGEDARFLVGSGRLKKIDRNDMQGDSVPTYEGA